MGSIAQLGVSLAVLGTAAALAYRGGRYWASRRRETQELRARREFLLRREWLEAKFLEIASASGLPRGLDWVDCDFDSPVSFARDRKSGDLTALVAVAIRFQAIEGGGMEDVEAVAETKAATAVFHHDGRRWITEGRAIFNLNPVQAIERFQSELETAD